VGEAYAHLFPRISGGGEAAGPACIRHDVEGASMACLNGADDAFEQAFASTE